MARCLQIVALAPPRSVAGDDLKGERAFTSRELPGVTINEFLRPAREVGYILGLVEFRDQRGVLEEVIDTLPRERSPEPRG